VAIGVAGLQVFDATGALVDHFGPDTQTERAQLCAALGASQHSPPFPDSARSDEQV